MSALIALIAVRLPPSIVPSFGEPGTTNHEGLAAHPKGTKKTTSGMRRGPLWSAIIGILGVASLSTRENALILVALLGVWIWFIPAQRRRRLTPRAVFAAGVTLVLAASRDSQLTPSPEGSI
jgi:hypothetical protein